MRTLTLLAFSAASVVSVPAFSADAPKPIEIAVAGYPLLPSGGRDEGEVFVDVAIDKDGAVTSAKATTGPERLRPWAEAAALKWRFETTTPGTTRIVFAFILQSGLTDPPAITAIFKPPSRVEVIAERRQVITSIETEYGKPTKHQKSTKDGK